MSKSQVLTEIRKTKKKYLENISNLNIKNYERFEEICLIVGYVSKLNSMKKQKLIIMLDDLKNCIN